MSSPEDITKFANTIELASKKLKLTLAESVYVLEALKIKWINGIK